MTDNPEASGSSPTTRVTVSQDVLCTSVNNVLLMLDTSDGVYYELDEVGERIWNLLVELGSVDAVVHALVAEFEVELREARDDVTHFVHELVDNGLATIHTDTDRSE